MKNKIIKEHLHKSKTSNNQSHQCHTMNKNSHEEHMGHNNQKNHEGHNHGDTYFLNNKSLTWIINLSLFVLATFYLIIKLINPSGNITYILHPGIWIGFSTIIIFTTGFKYFKVYKQLIIKQIYSVNLLMAIAAHSMFIYSIVISILGLINNTPYAKLHTMWPALIYIITLMDIGHSIEDKLNKSSQSGFDKLKKLKQRSVNVKRKNEIFKLLVEEVKINETIVVKTNEIVPLDGILISSKGELDTSNITGEAKYSNLVTGKYVISGSINRGKTIEIKINKTANDSTITRIINKIQDSSTKLTSSQGAIDKLVKKLIPAVLIIASITFISWIIIATTTSIESLPWSISKGKYSLAFDATFTVLDIAAPCALGMAIPLLTMVSSFIGGTNSIVFNSTKKIDEINNIKIVAFDKTGTITEDRFKIINIEGNKKLLGIVKTLEADLPSPIARSLFEHIDAKLIKITNKKQLIGKGVEGNYNGKKVHMAKSIKITKEKNEISTFISLYVENKEKLTFELQPKIKDHALKTIKKLKNKNIRVIMITGDRKKTALAIAKKVGIQECYYETSPEQKLEIVKKLQKSGKIMYIGDGFNDIAASRQSDVSVGFASGDEILNELTNISLVTNNLNTLLKLFELARLNSKATKWSIGSVFLFSFTLIPFAMLLFIPPFAGAIIMVLVDILVVWNSWIYKVIGSKKLKQI